MSPSKWCVHFIVCTVLSIAGTKIWAQSQLGAASLTQPGIAFSVDHLGSAHYIRPEDSLKTPATTSQRRYNFAAGFLLSSKVDTATKKIRTWSLAALGSYTRLTNDKYVKQIFPDELLTAGLAVLHYRTLNKKWGLQFILATSLSYDLKDFNGGDFFINGGVMFVKQVNAHFAYGIGGVLTNTFGVPMILPGFLIKWQTDYKVHIDVNFPEKIGVSYAFNKQEELALALRINGAAYNLPNRPDSNRLLAYRELHLGLENTLHLGKQLDFVLSGGMYFESGAEFREKAISDIFKKKPFHRLETNYFVSAGLRFNFQPRK